MQSNIDTLVSTSSSWGLKINCGKCKVIRFSPRSCPLPYMGVSPYSINGVPIDFSSSHSDLGVTVDRSLRFHSHIRQKATIVNALMSNLLSCTLSRDNQFMRSIYVSILRPKLEYASSLWNLGYIGDTKLLERVQRKWTKAVEGLAQLP